jgi:hypothetical protein
MTVVGQVVRAVYGISTPTPQKDTRSNWRLGNAQSSKSSILYAQCGHGDLEVSLIQLFEVSGTT